MNAVQTPVVRKSFWRALALTLLVALLNVGLWAWLNRPVQFADWHGEIAGLAFNPSQRYQDPTKLMEAYLACAQAQDQWSGAQDARRR